MTTILFGLVAVSAEMFISSEALAVPAGTPQCVTHKVVDSSAAGRYVEFTNGCDRAVDLWLCITTVYGTSKFCQFDGNYFRYELVRTKQVYPVGTVGGSVQAVFKECPSGTLATKVGSNAGFPCEARFDVSIVSRIGANCIVCYWEDTTFQSRPLLLRDGRILIVYIDFHSVDDYEFSAGRSYRAVLLTPGAGPNDPYTARTIYKSGAYYSFDMFQGGDALEGKTSGTIFISQSLRLTSGDSTASVIRLQESLPSRAWTATTISSVPGLNYGTLAVTPNGGVLVNIGGALSELVPPSTSGGKWSRRAVLPELVYSAGPTTAPNGKIYASFGGDSTARPALHQLTPPAPGQTDWKQTIILEKPKYALGSNVDDHIGAPWIDSTGNVFANIADKTSLLTVRAGAPAGPLQSWSSSIVTTGTRATVPISGVSTDAALSFGPGNRLMMTTAKTLRSSVCGANGCGGILVYRAEASADQRWVREATIDLANYLPVGKWTFGPIGGLARGVSGSVYFMTSSYKITARDSADGVIHLMRLRDPGPLLVR